jgi:RNA polymerase sigma factor (sigma-70 family)
MSDGEPIIFVIDDDESIRASLGRLLRTIGLRVETFASAQEFLRYARPDAPSCLVLDLSMPGLNGLELQSKLAGTDGDAPIVFITGHGDIPTSVRAIKAGAVEFLPKPFSEPALLAAVEQALARDRATRQQRRERAALRERLASLTPREREVLPLVVSGLLNKQIAARMGTTEKTIKVHRSRIMQKMQATSLVDLVHIAEKLDIVLPGDLIKLA